MSDFKARGTVVEFGTAGKTPVVFIERSGGRKLALRFWERDVQGLVKDLKIGDTIEVSVSVDSRAIDGAKGRWFPTDSNVDSAQILDGRKDEPPKEDIDDLPF